MFSEKHVGLGVDEVGVVNISRDRLSGQEAACGQGPYAIPPLRDTCYI